MHPRIIAIAGASGSGKTTLAKRIQEHYGDESVLTISMDDYYKDQGHMSLEERLKTNYDNPQESMDSAKLAQDLAALLRGETVQKPEYSFEFHTRKNETTAIQAKRFIVVESIFALSDQVLAQFQALKLPVTKIFVEKDLDFCLLHRIKRDIAERGRNINDCLKQYENQAGPGRRQFVSPSAANADVIVDNNLSDRDFDLSPVVEYIEQSLKTNKDEEKSKPSDDRVSTANVHVLFKHPTIHLKSKMAQDNRNALDTTPMATVSL